MADPLDFLNSRRSSRPLDLAEPGPDEAQLGRILTVAARVPDHGKLVPWRFVVLAGEGRKRMAETLAARLRAAIPPDRRGPDREGARALRELAFDRGRRFARRRRIRKSPNGSRCFRPAPPA